MISPHPDTARIVAEAARRERLASLAASHRHPGWLVTGSLYIVRFVADTGLLVGRMLARFRLRLSSHQTMRQQAGRDPASPLPSARHPQPGQRANPEFPRYRPSVNTTTSDVTDQSRALGMMNPDR